MLGYLRHKTIWLGVASCVLAAVGMAGYVDGRLTTNYGFVGLAALMVVVAAASELVSRPPPR